MTGLENLEMTNADPRAEVMPFPRNRRPCPRNNPQLDADGPDNRYWRKLSLNCYSLLAAALETAPPKSLALVFNSPHSKILGNDRDNGLGLPSSDDATVTATVRF